MTLKVTVCAFLNNAVWNLAFFNISISITIIQYCDGTISYENKCIINSDNIAQLNFLQNSNFCTTNEHVEFIYAYYYIADIKGLKWLSFYYRSDLCPCKG